jgi:hypothetical protein
MISGWVSRTAARPKSIFTPELVEAHLTDDDVHTTVLQLRVREVHAWLLEHF